MRVAPLLVSSDRWFVLQRQTDVVEPFEQHGLAEMVDFEREVQSLRVGHGLIREVGGELITLVFLGAAEKLIHLRFR